MEEAGQEWHSSAWNLPSLLGNFEPGFGGVDNGQKDKLSN